MAAKVVMVAVPTVLGIASIRVYTVNEAPTDGLVSRGKLNVYTPLPQSAQGKFVPESPGTIERGITTARESVLPVFQAVKGACISVKRGSVNLYHAGEDLFYYLKDPPPDFLPRFGTITMAGLLGMFLARKGSRFKRLALPLGLMSAGASVCYPAQAVAVFKVTGKKVYAAGQWSSAAVSSLFASKEPLPKETAVSQPQSATVPNKSAQSSTVSGTEVESAETDAAVASKEMSPVTLTEISTTETSTDPLTNAVPAETSPPSEEQPSPVAEPTLSIQSAPSSEETSAPKAADGPAVPHVESAEPELASQPPAAALEETPTQQPAEGGSKEGSDFKADPSLMDFGQSNPEDEDLYSTRS
ncbi:MICOS complex subunit MIC27 isoform X2 [Mugil cephalus]|uniref:MICOS complex subunit MIC27 isoform X2 n=1 Tax=Mugil cephalus TaxID=48193 RepID=UPI001FB57839|nr:MICOS complex subunit MIC27 isoform X2 [Mugil cephalus]